MIDLLVRFITVGHAHAASFNLAIPGNIDTSATPSPAGFIANFYQFGMVLAGILAFVVIVYAGVKYAISRGNPTQQGDATDRLTQAFLGILLLVGAYIILFVLNPGLTKLELPRLVQIDRSQTAEQVPTFNNGLTTPLATPGTNPTNPATSGGTQTTPSSTTKTPSGACGKGCGTGQACLAVGTAGESACTQEVTKEQFCTPAKTKALWYVKLQFPGAGNIPTGCTGPSEVLQTAVKANVTKIVPSCYSLIDCR